MAPFASVASPVPPDVTGRVPVVSVARFTTLRNAEVELSQRSRSMPAGSTVRQRLSDAVVTVNMPVVRDFNPLKFN